MQEEKNRFTERETKKEGEERKGGSGEEHELILDIQHLPKDILDPVHNICCFIQEREYVQANDAYLQMAIGNAPWPMGVTMVGIHERSAREKIFTNQVAHVLNDETQRKYIQAIKRIMTWAQRKYPNDPSKCVG